jgi:hypothetical protein
MMDYAGARSSYLGSQTTITPVMSKDGVLDLSVFDDNTTIFVNTEHMRDIIARSKGLKIVKRPGQYVVFNFSGTQEVKIGKFSVQEVDEKGSPIGTEVESTTKPLDGDQV